MNWGKIQRLRFDLHDARMSDSDTEGWARRVELLVDQLRQYGACSCATCAYSASLECENCVNRERAN